MVNLWEMQFACNQFDIEDFFTLQTFMIQDLLGIYYIHEKHVNEGSQATNVGIEGSQVNFINPYDYL